MDIEREFINIPKHEPADQVADEFLQFIYEELPVKHSEDYLFISKGELNKYRKRRKRGTRNT